MDDGPEGGCACGAVRYRLTAEPMIVHCCHCLNCQRQTGSAFVVNILIERANVELLAGDPEPVPVPRTEVEQVIWRCPDCRIAVFSAYGDPALRFVRAGTLDDPSWVEPDVHIYTRSKVAWVALPPSVPAFETFYDPAEVWRPETRARYAALSAAGKRERRDSNPRPPA